MMKKLISGLLALALTLAGVDLSPAGQTTAYTLTPPVVQDLGAAPVQVQVTLGIAQIVIADSPPSATGCTPCGMTLSPNYGPITFQAADSSSHAYAVITGSASAILLASPIIASGGGGTIGSVTQGTVPWVDTSQPTKGTGAYSSATVGTTDSTILAASTAAVFLDVVNVSASATICINVGATATISGIQCAAGEIALPPLWHRSWEGSFVPTDAIHAIASAASTQAAVGAK